MPDRSYHVVAMSLPIVYTRDGDHDPNGMLFTLQTYRPLLEFARDQWEAHDRLLPTLYRRSQLIELVVDGLERFRWMREALASGPVEDRELLHELGGETEVQDRAVSDARRGASDPRHQAVQQNYRATVDELVAALSELTDGATTELVADPAELDSWRQSWHIALRSVRAAIATLLAQVDAAYDEFVEAWTDSDLDSKHVQRLLLNDHRAVHDLAEHTPPYDRFNPLRPIPLVRPLVLRACQGETVRVTLENQLRGRRVGLHTQGEGLAGVDDAATIVSGVRFGDGAHVGSNHDSTVGFGDQPRTYVWRCPHEGVWAINDLGDVRGTEQGTNVHGLFGALIVEAAGSTWSDPEAGQDEDDTSARADGLYVDVRPPGEQPYDKHGQLNPAHQKFVDFYSDDVPRSFREFTIFFHDEPEIHSGSHLVGEHTVMPLSYRAEPMPNRLPHQMRRYAERTAPEPEPDQEGIDHSAVKIELDNELNEVFWIARKPDGTFLERVAGEEQHHSSWLFSDPVTPILRAYRGDPARIRLVHAGVKETHVFHLHVHQWRAVPQDTAAPSVWRDGEHRGSQLLDSITIGPQAAQTIDPLYGSGSRQHAVGDVIWHCHLYPHFHHGMWGLWRSFDRRVDGYLAYPDGTPCPPLKPLPGRDPREPDPNQPGFPWFIDATFPRKSPPPPALREQHLSGRRRLLEMPLHSASELAAFDPGCVADPRPGALFVNLDGLAQTWNDEANLPERRVISYDVEVAADRVDYNRAGWHDQRGHHYQLTGVEVTTLSADGTETSRVRHTPPTNRIETFYPRANHGDVVELRFYNRLGSFPADDFDLATLPVECGLHVHLVKFDVLTADGSSTGWNYLAGASCREAVGPDLVDPDMVDAPSRIVGFHRWVVDEEFGPCFFHDHLLANYRQKHGLFAALIAEPQGSRWLLPDQVTPAWSGPQAVVLPPEASGLPPYREACLAIGDFVPLYRYGNDPVNPPHQLGGDDDPGGMGVNFRNSPLTLRGPDPSQWFSSTSHTVDTAEPQTAVEPIELIVPGATQRDPGDPDTELIGTYPGERLRLRLIQGSHEEQHSFVLHGMRWRRDWHNPGSPLVNQQTTGLSEAFTLDIDPAAEGAYGIGDHLWSFSAMDDLWLGCWGLVRALPPNAETFTALPPLPRAEHSPRQLADAIWAASPTPPRPTLVDAKWVDAAGSEVNVRPFVVTARRVEHRYAGEALTDPWGLVYELADGWVEELERDDRTDEDNQVRLTGNRRATGVHRTREPLVLRAHPGEWVRVTLINEVRLDEEDPETDPLLPDFGPEVSPPRLPVEHTDQLGYPDQRQVSPRVSLHPSLLAYDVIAHDGAYVGHNRDGTVGALPVEEDHVGHVEGGGVVLRDDHGSGHRDANWREYWWYAGKELAPADHADGPGQVCYLHDMGDIRNHRHHGLIGALVVEPGDCIPDSWTGPRARLLNADGQEVATEIVVLLQDGLRHFVAGDPALPVRDVVPDDDPEDSGQKGINYRSALVSTTDRLAVPQPATPVFAVPRDQPLWVRLVCAADKPRNHTFTVHGLAWDFAPWVTDGPRTDSISGLSAGTTETLVLTPRDAGDHAYRSGVFRWAVGQGMWGIIRVPDPTT